MDESVSTGSNRGARGGRAWELGNGRRVDLSEPRIMAIVNVTPDSFHAESRTPGVEAAVERCRLAVRAGADLIDLGGESTRPGAERVPPDEQIARLEPVVRAIRGDAELRDLPISIDTTRAEVAWACLEAGADAINDVAAGTEDEEMLTLAGERGCGLILMHRLADPTRDSYSDRYAVEPSYADVVAEVGGFLRARAAAAERAGVRRGAILIDPGLGFGKTVGQNLELIARTGELASTAGGGYGVLSAASRKSFVGRASLGRESTPEERLAGSIAASVLHLSAGARVFRVHDPGPQGEALRLAWRVLGAGDAPSGRGG
ncbi:MAG: dihydropteroate synthase [Phycisphaerales bacterium JB037]